MGGFSFNDAFQPTIDAVGNGTFDPMGINARNSWGASNAPAQNSVTSSDFGLKGSPLPAIGGSASSATPGASQPAGTTSTPPASTTGSSSTASANNWFVRAVIVILGFIFVAVGLSQFGVVQKLGR